MASRRPPTTATQQQSTQAAEDPEEKPRLHRQPEDLSAAPPTGPAVPAATIIKLAFFTISMFALPLAAYFISLRTVFGGNSTYAGALAALTANVVLVAYILVAVWEDQGEQAGEEAERERARRGGKVKKGE